MQIKSKELAKFIRLVTPVVRAKCSEKFAIDGDVSFCVPLESIISSIANHESEQCNAEEV